MFIPPTYLPSDYGSCIISRSCCHHTATGNVLSSEGCVVHLPVRKNRTTVLHLRSVFGASFYQGREEVHRMFCGLYPMHVRRSHGSDRKFWKVINAKSCDLTLLPRPFVRMLMLMLGCYYCGLLYMYSATGTNSNIKLVYIIRE